MRTVNYTSRYIVKDIQCSPTVTDDDDDDFVYPDPSPQRRYAGYNYFLKICWLIPEIAPNFLTVNFEPHLVKPVVASLPFALLGCPHGAARMSSRMRTVTVSRLHPMDHLSEANRHRHRTIGQRIRLVRMRGSSKAEPEVVSRGPSCPIRHKARIQWRSLQKPYWGALVSKPRSTTPGSMLYNVGKKRKGVEDRLQDPSLLYLHRTFQSAKPLSSRVV